MVEQVDKHIAERIAQGKTTNAVKAALTILVALQQADNSMARLEKELAGVERRIAELDAKIAAEQEQAASGQERLDGLKKQYRATETEVKVVESRVIKSEEKLRSVKTNKEYQALLKEIDEMKLKASAMEDQMIHILEQIEAAETEMVEREADLADLKQEVQAQQEEIRQAASQQRLSLEGYTQERDTIWNELAPKLQQMYTRVKKQGRGIAVAAVVDAVCQVCRMNIPPQLFNELLRMDEMRMCPNCQRIIYPQAALEG